MWKFILPVLFLFLSTPAFSQPGQPTFAISVSDDDTTVYTPYVIGFSGTQVSEEGGKAIIRIVGGSGSGDIEGVTAGAGLGGGGTTGTVSLNTDSTEAAFLASGALTCGAGTAGKMQIHTTPLQYCDNAATPALQYAAYGSSTGVATSTTSDSTWTSHNSYPAACAASNWMTTIGDTVTCSQPAFTDISGAATDAQVPNTITVDLATTATTANAGDSATAFFPSGTLEETLLPDGATVTTWVLGASTATTPAADDNDTSLATSAYVQTEINAAGGRSLACASGSCDADVELYTDTKCIWWENPVAGDDFKSIWIADNYAVTVTRLWCESDQTVNTMLQVDDGAPADMDTVDLACITTPDTDTALDGDATIAAGDRVDVDVASVSGTPTWVSVCFTFTRDD